MYLRYKTTTWRGLLVQARVTVTVPVSRAGRGGNDRPCSPCRRNRKGEKGISGHTRESKRDIV
jgi:hypothetical protein